MVNKKKNSRVRRPGPSSSSTDSRIRFQLVPIAQEDITLNLDGGGVQEYRAMIESIAAQHGVFRCIFKSSRAPKLLQVLSSTGSQKTFDIYLQLGGKRIGCRFLHSSFYFFAFNVNGGVWHMLHNWYDRKHVFPTNLDNLNMQYLPEKLSVSYGSLGHSKGRNTLLLGKQKLMSVIMNLGHYEDRGYGVDVLSWSCLTICQMIPEAVRFPQILNAICFGFDGPGLPLSSRLVKFQTNYVKMCKNLVGHSIIERLQKNLMPLEVFDSVAVMKEVGEMMLVNEGDNTYVVSEEMCTMDKAHELIMSEQDALTLLQVYNDDDHEDNDDEDEVYVAEDED